MAAGTRVCPAEAWEAARIEAGQPVLGREIDERTIAAEVGLVERTVSFTKGCFTGQELVARLDARGSNVARRLCGVVLDRPSGDAADLVGAAVWSPGTGGGESGTPMESEMGTARRSAALPRLPGHPVSMRWSPSPCSTGPSSRPKPSSCASSRASAGRAAAEARPLPLIEPA